ncbi:hypothetical protein SAMN05444392_10472 [Seinonella peptonophila]|uniref:Uncharacterized protein n=1 Tax=Seinonella peptonophila TaxID=112248 RepID=A0A1M4X143_9BACL|nr:hypothetical protein SAMN05444392_10472 [Seinonella peptonophila]
MVDFQVEPASGEVGVTLTIDVRFFLTDGEIVVGVEDDTAAPVSDLDREIVGAIAGHDGAFELPDGVLVDVDDDDVVVVHHDPPMVRNQP